MARRPSQSQSQKGLAESPLPVCQTITSSIADQQWADHAFDSDDFGTYTLLTAH
jgi:hypothetical protein